MRPPTLAQLLAQLLARQGCMAGNAGQLLGGHWALHYPRPQGVGCTHGSKLGMQCWCTPLVFCVGNPHSLWLWWPFAGARHVA